MKVHSIEMYILKQQQKKKQVPYVTEIKLHWSKIWEERQDHNRNAEWLRYERRITTNRRKDKD